MADQLIQPHLSFRGQKSEFLRFQLKLLSLEQGSYSELDDDRFVTDLVSYLIDLYRANYVDFSHRILIILGNCSVSNKAHYREKALFALYLFAENFADTNTDETTQALSWIFSRWLQQEQDFLSCFEIVCRQLQNLLEKMISQGMYCQLTPWLSLLYRIVNGTLVKRSAIQVIVTRLHGNLLGSLFQHDLDLTEVMSADRRENLECLYRYFTTGGAVPLVQELYASSDKERRLALISTLSRLNDDVAFLLIENLADNSPWYMVRNAIQIISHLGNIHHFDLVRPFLSNPDVRVQQQIIGFISRLDGQKSLDQRLDALEVCDDRLKLHLIPPLAVQGSRAVEFALVHILENRSNINPKVRDELILMLCRELRYFPTVRVVKTLRHLVDERKFDHDPDDSIIMTAKQTIESLCSL